MNVPLIDWCRRIIAESDSRAMQLCTEEPHLQTQKLFRNVVFGVLFLHTVLLLPYHAEVWSEHALVTRPAFSSERWQELIHTASLHSAITPWYQLFIWGQLLCLALGLLNVFPRLMTIAAFLLTINLEALNNVILDGGNNLSRLMLFYLIFINTTGKPLKTSWPWLTAVLIAVSNAAVFTAKVQVVLVYASAGLYKVTGHLWQTGMALYYIWQTDSYSHPFVRELILNNAWLSMIGSYGAIAFQLLFPTLIWLPRWRWVMIGTGILFHLGIMLSMALFTFSLFMWSVYVLFFPNAVSLRVLQFWGARPRLRLALPGRELNSAPLGRWLRRLDWRGSLELEVSGSGTALLSTEAGQSIPRGRWVLELCGKLPLGWPLAPLAALFFFVGLGEKLDARLFGVSAANSEGLEVRASSV